MTRWRDQRADCKLAGVPGDGRDDGIPRETVCLIIAEPIAADHLIAAGRNGGPAAWSLLRSHHDMFGQMADTPLRLNAPLIRDK